MPISALKEKIRARLEDPTFPEIVSWKKDNPGRKAIGYFPVYVPVELISAAGMLPVMVSGAMGTINLDEADGALQSFVCSVGRSTLELKLDGNLDNLDGMIFPSTCEISRGLSGVWHRRGSGEPCIYLHYPQNLNTPAAKNYMLGELNRLKDMLEQIGGREITNSDINSAFELYNRRSVLFHELDKFRSDHPDRLSISEFYVLRLAGMSASCEEHIKILEEVLGELETAPPRYKTNFRIAVVGAFCERPPIAMLETIEEQGIAIIYDDFLLGQRWFSDLLPITDDPMGALADFYLTKVINNSLVYQPGATPCEGLENILKERKADGIFLLSAKSCNPAHHDNACISKMCEKMGFPYLKFEFEEDQRVFESIRVVIEALLEARERLPYAGTETNNSNHE